MTMLTFPLHHIIPTVAKIIIQSYIVFSLDCTQIEQEFKFIGKGLTSLSQTCVGDSLLEVWQLAHYQMQTQTSGCQIWSLACFALLSYLQNTLWSCLIWEGNPIDAEISHYFKEGCNFSCDYLFCLLYNFAYLFMHRAVHLRTVFLYLHFCNCYLRQSNQYTIHGQ